MGQRTDDPEFEFGAACGLGFGLAAPLWLLNETPKFVYARFSMIKRCDIPSCAGKPYPPNDRVFRLEQEPGFPCWWTYHGDWDVYWQFRSVPPTWIQFGLTHTGENLWYFYDDFNANNRDPRFTHNILACTPFFDCGFDGVACIRWGPEAKHILNAINMTYEYDRFMELRPLDNGNMVYKFCRIKESTNIKILFDPTT